MIDNERNKVEEIDKSILSELKRRMEIKREPVSVIPDKEIECILKKINEKMEIIHILFQGGFSINERTIEERLEYERQNLTPYDSVANNIILKRLDAAIKTVEDIYPQNGRLISVCFDRKFFIEKVLTQNISLPSIKKYIQVENIER